MDESSGEAHAFVIPLETSAYPAQLVNASSADCIDESVWQESLNGSMAQAAALPPIAAANAECASMKHCWHDNPPM